MALIEGQNLSLKFNFRHHLSTFRTINTPKSEFFTLKIVNIGQIDHVTEAKISRKNLDFGGNQKYLQADTAWPSKSKTMPYQF